MTYKGNNINNYMLQFHITGSSQQQNILEQQWVTCAIVHFIGLVHMLAESRITEPRFT